MLLKSLSGARSSILKYTCPFMLKILSPFPGRNVTSHEDNNEIAESVLGSQTSKLVKRKTRHRKNLQKRGWKGQGKEQFSFTKKLQVQRNSLIVNDEKIPLALISWCVQS